MEPEAVEQIARVASLPILAGPVVVMPDVHVGIGATVGTVIATGHAIIPAAVGVDIGCGMCAVRTDLRAEDLPSSLSRARSRIEALVPVGFAIHREVPEAGEEGRLGPELARRLRALERRFEKLAILERLGRLDRARIWRQVASLGGGNHFIELCLDEDGAVWIMLHSGSRNIGKTIGEAAIEMARSYARQRGFDLPDRDLAWLEEGTREFAHYVEALEWAQDYAALNRDWMLARVHRALEEAFGRAIERTLEAVNCHHNYAARERHFGRDVWITRKGAVRARAGELGIIPGSMGARSYIVRGLGRAESYCSCSHGAGRRLSRGAARRLYDLEALKRQTEGVECRKDAGVLDEIPAAYKDIDQVMAAQRDLVEIVHTLKQVLCVKG